MCRSCGPRCGSRRPKPTCTKEPLKCPCPSRPAARWRSGPASAACPQASAPRHRPPCGPWGGGEPLDVATWATDATPKSFKTAASSTERRHRGRGDGVAGVRIRQGAELVTCDADQRDDMQRRHTPDMAEEPDRCARRPRARASVQRGERSARQAHEDSALSRVCVCVCARHASCNPSECLHRERHDRHPLALSCWKPLGPYIAADIVATPSASFSFAALRLRRASWNVTKAMAPRRDRRPLADDPSRGRGERYPRGGRYAVGRRREMCGQRRRRRPKAADTEAQLCGKASNGTTTL